ncbi:MAG: VIT domain-containing protein, partial [Candidatus Margulisiibacteriota bacterium]
LLMLTAGIFLAIGLFQMAWSGDSQSTAVNTTKDVTQGCLRTTDAKGNILEFPLKHTAVSANISGFIAQVEVKQYFKNPYKEKIEAIYVFPLPENAAVNQMFMTVGSRNIYAEIKKRAEARQIYETARSLGKRTALLEQERPNIFTQSVANIGPGEEIIITLTYVQPLKYDRGIYSYVFPMVVGPRFIPGDIATGKTGHGWAPDTNAVPDASRITPPVLKPGRRNGHDISLTVNLDAGLSIKNLQALSHAVDIVNHGQGKATISIKSEDSIPNKDFILEYCAAGDNLRSAYLTHFAQQGGYVMLMLQPALEKVKVNPSPKEIFFVVDCSGSMSGFPIQKVKEAMYKCIQGISGDDTFQIIKFSETANAFAKEPVPATYLHKEEALDYIQALDGEGGTMMIEGIKACLDAPKTRGRQRVVFFMTDGYIGNEAEILAAIKAKVGETKIFSFGIGSSTNRYLLESIAQLGGSTAQFIRQDQAVEPVILDMLSRVSKPYLTDVRIDWGGLKVDDIFPNPLPDLYSAQPLVIFGRYQKGGEATVTLKGKINCQPFSEKIKVTLPDWNPDNSVLATIWAREKIKYLTLEEISGKNTQVAEDITNLALEYNLMSQYTSFVAVDEILPEDGSSTLPKIIAIPVPMPEGVNFTGVFGSPNLYPGEYVTEIIGQTKKGDKDTDVKYGSLCPAPNACYSTGKIAGKDCWTQMQESQRGTGQYSQSPIIPTKVATATVEQIPALTKTLLQADCQKEYREILLAAAQLAQLSNSDKTSKTNHAKIQAAFAQALLKDYPASVGSERINLKAVLHYFALVNLSGYNQPDIYPALLKLTEDKSMPNLHILAIYQLLNYPNPEMRPRLRAILASGKIDGSIYDELRTKIYEKLMSWDNPDDIHLASKALRRDPSWKVRRAILAKLAAAKQTAVLEYAIFALQDPHPLIKQLALTEAIAASATPAKRANYLEKIAKDPTPASCQKILLAEKIDPDLSLKSMTTIKAVLAGRGVCL